MRATAPLLSICIPTYNRAGYIAQTVSSFELEKHPNVEMIVVDDASTDNTPIILENLAKKYSNLHSIRNQRNLHLDKNTIKAMSLAKGKYCWLFGDDDYVKPGAVAKIITLLKHHQPELLLPNYSRFNNVTQKITKLKMIDIPSHMYTNAQNFYFRPTPNSYFPYLGINLIFMSILIFNRKSWNKAVTHLAGGFTDSNYFHTFATTQIMNNSPQIYFYSQPLVVYRDANIRPWRNRDIWGYYRNQYLKFCSQLGWNRLNLVRVYWKIWYDRSAKNGVISKVAKIIHGTQNSTL